jgi:hypothetical protein
MIEWIRDHFHEDVDAEVYKRDGQSGREAERQNPQKEEGGQVSQAVPDRTTDECAVAQPIRAAQTH